MSDLGWVFGGIAVCNATNRNLEIVTHASPRLDQKPYVISLSGLIGNGFYRRRATRQMYMKFSCRVITVPG